VLLQFPYIGAALQPLSCRSLTPEPFLRPALVFLSMNSETEEVRDYRTEEVSPARGVLVDKILANGIELP